MKIKRHQKTENILYPMDRELIRQTQISQSLHRDPKDIPRITDEERAFLRASLSLSLCAN